MPSTRLGCLPIDDDRLAADLSTLSKARFTDAYAEFAFGLWRTLMVRNYDGTDEDAVIRMYHRPAVETLVGHTLPYLRKLIDDHFDASRLRYARIMKIECNAGVIPHRDYLEFSEPYIRLHLPIQTDENCMNSEGGQVLHLCKGEVWYLDAAQIHSAVSFSKKPRMHLVMDFAGGVSPISLVRNCAFAIGNPAPIYRPKMPDSVKEAIKSLGCVLDECNLMDVISILCKLHFKYQSEPECVFEWLADMARVDDLGTLGKRIEFLELECIKARSGGRLSENAAGISLAS